MESRVNIPNQSLAPNPVLSDLSVGSRFQRRRGGFFGDKMKCYKCPRPAVMDRGNKLCARHVRLEQMRSTSKRKGKLVPSFKYLENMVDQLGPAMLCPSCDFPMIWFRKYGDPGKTVTIQHDHSGTIRLICHSCNARHQYFPNDSFYDMDPRLKKCGTCKKSLPPDQFHYARGSTRWKDRHNDCKKCTNAAAREYRAKNKIAINARRRLKRVMDLT